MPADKIRAPSSSTGLMRVYDVTASTVLLDPRVVVGATIAFIVVELVIQII